MISNYRTPEFDRFGPWIDEVRTVEDVPRLYRGAGLDPAAYRLMLKIPRDIERRNATADMDLYDHLLAVDEESFVVLSRRDHTYDAIRLPLDRIAAVQDSTHLLDGCLTVFTIDGGAVSVHYNGSADGPVLDLVRLLRRGYLPEGPAAGPGPHPYPPRLDLGRQEAGLVTDFERIMAREPRMRLLNVGGRQVVTPVSPVERLYRAVRPVTLLASITVTDDRELLFLHHRAAFSPGGDDLSLARTVLPRARISAVYATPDTRYLGVHVVTVQAGAARFDFPSTAGPATEALLTRTA
ncbi:hypothetical protein ACIA8K_36555 [Catenuloplanes sp. NPDC051500]|uniref:hypothetical protein n=1 Tax=Catenuloplanes sp. NPDC051500 TaxID=3363959 RepID=UPI003798A31C